MILHIYTLYKLYQISHGQLSNWDYDSTNMHYQTRLHNISWFL